MNDNYSFVTRPDTISRRRFITMG